MRIAVSLLLALFLCTGVSAETAALDGFWGIKWGASAEEAKTSLLTHKGLTINDEHYSSDGMILFEGDTFGGMSFQYGILVFYEGLFCKGAVAFQPKEHEVIGVYAQWLANLTEKYGKPKESFRRFLSPYEEGDGYETQAISNGKGYLGAYWTFPVKDAEDNGIYLEITDELQVSLRYENTLLLGKVVQKKKEKESQDY